jgi:GT2 family glycosyltransferase/lipopolysaccharide/colanic/teichoic acid biosynthesis glycosyltransferase
MDLSVIIVNYNVRQLLENALTSIGRAMQGLRGEVFVVDNASDDGSIEMVKAKFPDVHLIENNYNAGFAKGNNVALARAAGHYILFINPDTIVQEDTIHVMLQFFRENPDVGLAGCKVLNPDGSFQLACRRSFPTPWVAFTKISGLSTMFPRSRLFGRYNLTYLSEDETYEVEAISGSFMMMSRAAYEKVGGFDETFFMYGEDLDLCYRVSQGGFKVCYVHSTRIIHYKGESTKRSDLDEIRLFYIAMHQFVEKHFSSSLIAEIFLTLGILLRASLAFIAKAAKPLLLALVDVLLVDLALILAEYLYLHQLFHFPDYAYPVVYTVPAGILVATMFFLGLYTDKYYAVSRAAAGVIISYVVISASVFFAKDFAFSRAVVLISGFLSLLLLPGWRLMIRALGGGKYGTTRKSLFGRRTLIIGTGPSGQEVLRKLRLRIDDGYDVVGFIGQKRKEIGEKIGGVEIVGSMENVGKVISERRVGEVIFSTDGLSYSDILSVIGRSSNRNVNFRLVPNSLEAIIGKTRIDELDDLPLVDIQYNIHKPVNRIVKRAFDILVASFLLILVYPLVRFAGGIGGAKSPGRFVWRILLLPQVFSGRLSLVGRPMADLQLSPSTKTEPSYLGPVGLTGLAQINKREELDREEIERYKLYYAKNQSLILDIEILLKSVLLSFKKT